jgi:hypothetical protein
MPVPILSRGRRGKYSIQRKGVIKQREIYDVGIKGEEEAKLELNFTLEQAMKTQRGLEI